MTGNALFECEAGINRYDEYGIPAAANIGRFQYTGQVWLNDLGMYNYKARIYSPTLGRFMQTDPIGYADGLNLYAYVRNDPINHIDPSGTDCYNPAAPDWAHGSNECGPWDEITVTGGSGSGWSDALWSISGWNSFDLPAGAGAIAPGAQNLPQSGLRGVLCAGGKLAKSASDAGVDAGLEVAVLGGLGGAAVGAFAEGVGAIPGAIAGATPGLSMAGVAGTVGSLGQFAMDLSTSHSARDFGVASIRAGVGVFGGRIIGRATRGIGRAWLDKAQQLQRGERIGNVADQALSKIDGFLNPDSGC